MPVTAPTPTDMRAMALDFLDMGLCPMPPKQDGSKRPYVGEWKDYEHRLPTSREIMGWYRSELTGIGTVCGEVAGNLELFEFDDLDTYLAFCEVAVEAGMAGLVERVKGGYSERTPGLGVHWFYRCEEIAGNTKLASVPRPTPDNPKGVKVLIETRGQGGYAVMAPSYGTVHPSGLPYEVMEGRPEDIARVTPEERAALWALARSFDQMPVREVKPSTVRTEATGDRPGDIFNRDARWADVLGPAGWKAIYTRGETTYWRRPGKSHGVSATTNHTGNDTLIVFSSSTPFEVSPSSYSKFAAYTVLECDGDYQRAGKELLAQGYGEAPQGVYVSLTWDRPETVDEETGEVVVALAPGRVLLDEAIRRGVPPPDWLVEDVLVRGAIHLIYGEPESGKTILALRWVLDTLAVGGNVLFVDEESGLAAAARLLAAMGAESVDEGLHYFPFPSLDLDDAPALVSYAESVQPSLVVFDSLTDMLASAGLDENSGVEVTRWMVEVAQRLARSPYAPAVVLVDHISKDAANTKYSIASRAKKAKSDVLWLVDKLADFDQDRTANVDLHRHKNRPGVLPKKVRFVLGGEDGRLIADRFDPLQHGITSLSDGARELLTELGSETLGNEALRGRTGRSDEWVRQHIKELRDANLVEMSGSGRMTVYRSLSPIGERFPQIGEALTPTFSPNSTPLKGGIGEKERVGETEEEDDLPAYYRRQREKGNL